MPFCKGTIYCKALPKMITIALKEYKQVLYTRMIIGAAVYNKVLCKES